MDLKALLLIQGVIVATCLSTFVAARQLAPEPSASSPSASSSSSSFCSRALATTLWGAAFAFFSLMADAWPASKAVASVWSEGFSLSDRLTAFFILGPVAPMTGIGMTFRQMFVTLRFRQILRRSTNPELGPDSMSMSNKLRRVKDDILVTLFGIDQPPGFLKSTRIVASTYIALGMSGSTKLPNTHIDTDESPVQADNMADALTLGHKTAENSCLMELNEAGKLALLQSSILPNYKQLRFLDGRSGIATLILGVQAIGYVTSIVYRAIHHLPVSPIEAIGFSLSMLVIVQSLVHSVGVLCQNPLVIYLNPAQEQEMVDQSKSTRWSYVDNDFCNNAGLMGMVVVGSVVVAFAILVEWHVLRISWLDAIGPILFLLCLITQSFLTIISVNYLDHATLEHFLSFGNGMISFGGIVVSVVATIVNWQTNKFDSRTPSVIHNLPFLG
ncbi:unnamed protein product [Sphagnum troendelagicum]|uniref:Uncharacterized protein n=1 Tax=Sphagnum troendelagicum TaxID=128251 RepID=A0ABP0TL14_9BRYO